MKAHFADNADDFAHDPALFVVTGINAEAFADWVFARKILLGHCLIDNDDARRVFRIAFVKRATPQQRQLERRKIIAADHFEIAVQHVGRLRPRIFFAPKTSLPTAHERPIRTHGGILYAGQCAHFVQQRLCEYVDLVAVVIFFPW